MRSFFCMLVCAVTLMASGELSGRRAPGFSLPDMNLKQYDLQDYRGKLVLVDIMQTADFCLSDAGKSLARRTTDDNIHLRNLELASHQVADRLW